MGGEAGTDEAVVMSESLCVGNVTEAREERGRALDVCEEEGQGLREESLGDRSGLARRLVSTTRHHRLDRPVSVHRPSPSVCLAPGAPLAALEPGGAALEHGVIRHGDALENTSPKYSVAERHEPYLSRGYERDSPRFQTTDDLVVGCLPPVVSALVAVARWGR